MKNFRPMLSRVPLGPGKSGLSNNSHLVLQVDCFNVIAAFGADVWGSPVDVEFNTDIKTWVEGLRQGGGEG